MDRVSDKLKIEVIKAPDLTPEKRETFIALCNRAYEDDLAPLFEVYPDPTHVIGYLDGAMISHAMLVTRWLQNGAGPLLRTAYVEMVATDPQLQGQGFASEIMQRVGNEITGYELGALWPNYPDWYARFGWVTWRGPLFIRTAEGLLPTPDEHVMVLTTPNNPPLDLDGPLSAEWREGELW
jgi:aminoglycoside 2'-N-acetyltransferase I